MGPQMLEGLLEEGAWPQGYCAAEPPKVIPVRGGPSPLEPIALASEEPTLPPLRWLCSHLHRAPSYPLPPAISTLTSALGEELGKQPSSLRACVRRGQWGPSTGSKAWGPAGEQRPPAPGLPAPGGQRL